MGTNEKEYMRKYMQRKALEKYECKKCYKTVQKYSKSKHEKTKYHCEYEEGGKLNEDKVNLVLKINNDEDLKKFINYYNDFLLRKE